MLSFSLLSSSLCRDNPLVADFELDLYILGKRIEFPESCSLSVGGQCSIAAIVFWFVAAVTSGLSLMAEKYLRHHKEKRPPQGKESLDSSDIQKYGDHDIHHDIQK